MRSITGQLPDELTAHVGRDDVAKAKPLPVKSYRELMEHVAKLAYLNKDYLLFFRGQDHDYQNKAGASTVYPAIYRGERVSREQLELRFDVLTSAANRLCIALKSEEISGHNDVRRRKLIQWSILQHYEVCPTPLLDLTHSLRVACSFAFLSDGSSGAFVHVFGLPYITNRISVNSEHDLAIVRLLSICPPEALRPYFQDGYLAATDEVTSDYDSKDELDFNRRLIAKFKLTRRGASFWGSGFSALPKTTLYPRSDKVGELCETLKRELGTEIQPGRLGQFLQDWTDVESLILSVARRRREKVFNVREALSVLRETEVLPGNIGQVLDQMRRLRNRAVHEPRKLEPNELAEGRQQLAALREQLNRLDL